MSSDRNRMNAFAGTCTSLVDWDMSSDRNKHITQEHREFSLVDWDMSSDRNKAGSVADTPAV